MREQTKVETVFLHVNGVIAVHNKTFEDGCRWHKQQMKHSLMINSSNGDCLFYMFQI